MAQMNLTMKTISKYF